MLTRHKMVIQILSRLGGETSRLQLVKLCFLLKRETKCGGGNAFYEFVPYKHGPFSFTLYRELEALGNRGLIDRQDERAFGLTDEGFRSAKGLPEPLKWDVAQVVEDYADLPLDDLIEHVYSSYPWFTVNASVEERRTYQRPVGSPAVHTIGYQGFHVDGFLNRLMRCGIQRIVDVRRNPISRVYGFHKSTLSRLCSNLGIEYCHHPELGIPSAERRNLGSAADYARLMERYRGSVLARETAAVEKVAGMLDERPSVLMCAEADPAFCHRSSLAQAVTEVASLPVKHLEWPR